MAAQWGRRPEQPGGQERQRKPSAEQERARWLDGSQRACEVQPRCPETLVVSVAERAGDLHAWCLEARPRVPGARAAGISRAQGQRRLAQETAPPYRWEDMQQARAAGHLTVDLPRPPGRPPRPAPLSVAVTRVTCLGARRPGGRLPPVEVVAV